MSPESEVWLITCTPGQPAWSHYGHTALRIKDPQQHFDQFYNYGLFDFNQPNFYLNFVQGKTDYMLGREDSAWFYFEYEEMDRIIYRQQLNLNLEQKNQLLRKLEINALPENRTYRYNFVFNNCSSKPYQLIDQLFDQEFITPQFNLRHDTFRDRITYYSGKNTWAGWGINILFGRDADQIMTPQQRLFLPEELMDYMQEATFNDGDTIAEMVIQSEIQPFIPRDNGWFLSPSFAIILLILFMAAITLYDVFRHKISWWLDAILFLVYAVLGCLLTYLTFWSEHPFVSSNFNLLFFNPLMFIPFVLCLFKKGHEWLRKADIIFGIYIILALVIYLVSGQEFHSVVWIMIVHAIRLRFTWYGNIFLLGQKTLRQHKQPLTDKTKSIILIPALLLGSTYFANAQAPHLTVVIVADGLNTKNLQQAIPQLTPGGIRTIIDEGKTSRVYFPQLIYGGCEATTTIVTGETPFYHGIAAPSHFDRQTKKITPVFQDNEYTGIGTNQHLSPKAILTPTVTDLFRLHNGKDSRIYAIGINPDNTIVLAGHAANACMWQDKSTKGTHWATTNYYPIGLHPQADNANTTASLTTSPNYNVITLAQKIQEKELLGEGLQNDMLLLEVSATTPQQIQQLNQDLQPLVKQLYRRVGSQNMRLVFVGKPKHGFTTEELDDAKLPHGTFNVEQTAALLNTYLMAMFGNGQYILGGHYNSVYINHQLLEKRNINQQQLYNLAAQFLLEFNGTQSVYTAEQIPLIQGDSRQTEGKLRNSFNKQCFGDLLFTLQYGYQIINSDQSTDQVVETDPEVPMYILGNMPAIPATLNATQILQYIIN